MPETREPSPNEQHFPPAAARIAVAEQLHGQLLLQWGATGDTSVRGEPRLAIRDGVECVLPSVRSLFDFVRARVLERHEDGTYMLLVSGMLPRHGYPDSYEPMPEIECTVRFPDGLPTAVESHAAPAETVDKVRTGVAASIVAVAGLALILGFATTADDWSRAGKMAHDSWTAARRSAGDAWENARRLFGQDPTGLRQP